MKLTESEVKQIIYETVRKVIDNNRVNEAFTAKSFKLERQVLDIMNEVPEDLIFLKRSNMCSKVIRYAVYDNYTCKQHVSPGLDAIGVEDRLGMSPLNADYSEICVDGLDVEVETGIYSFSRLISHSKMGEKAKKFIETHVCSDRDLDEYEMNNNYISVVTIRLWDNILV